MIPTRSLPRRGAPAMLGALALLVPALLALAAPAGAVDAVPLLSHRATYELSLAGSRGARPIESARGRIAVEFSGTPCEGYATTFRQVTRLADGEGRVVQSELRSTTWEEGAGRSFRFSTQQKGGASDGVDGRAERAGDGAISVRLTRPRPARLDLDREAAFPTEHVRRLIEAASAGRNILEARVFDGSTNGEKVYDTTAVLGAPVTGEKGLDAPLVAAGLAPLRRWPVTISYFEPGEGERTPAYVLGFDLLENGVSGSLRLDYGDFALRGEVKSVEALPAPAACRG